MKSLLRRATAKLDALARRHTDFDETAFLSLEPEGRQPRGNVLLAYVVEALLLRSGQAIPHSHTHYGESVQMARTFLDLGYAVDAISFRNTGFVPKRDYRIFVAARINFAQIAERLNRDCLKIVHLDVSHWLYNNAAAHQRALALQQRRGVSVALSRKLQQQNWAIEHADCATILGNELTMSTYRYAGKPLYPLPVPTAMTYPWPDGKDFEAARRHYLWFGSDGLVHKGLDLALEAFAGMPDYQLTVCGPIAGDPCFERAYRKELYETPNIRTLGWMDIASPAFVDLTRRGLGMVYPSAAEGSAGCVVTCQHAALIPVVSEQSGIDVGDFGVLLKDCSVGEIQRTVQELSARDVTELAGMARRSWEQARSRYTRERYAQEYRRAIESIIAQHDEGNVRSPGVRRP